MDYLTRHACGVVARLAAMVIVMMTGRLHADPPPGYYSAVDDTSATTLRNTLHPVIDDHTRFPYTSSSTDTWDILNNAQEDPNNPNNILDIYRNRSFPKITGGSRGYNREHVWPKSYGFPDDGSSNYPYTDCHQLHLCDSGYNSDRSNKPFRTCSAGCAENTTDANNGEGGGSGSYPGNSNWTSGDFSSGTWETWSGRRGDIARAMFYLDIRYEGGTHNGTGAAEPNLILTNNESQIANSNTGSNESVAYMGLLAVLLQWHVDDPVDDHERDRNDVVFSYQGNRNPFVDHPEWVACLFSGSCTPAGGPPADPTQLIATAGDGIVTLDWADNTESDLDGYDIHRALISGGPYTTLNGSLLNASSTVDTTVSNGTTYYYVVSAWNTATQESGYSNQASATPMAGGGGPGSGDPWINEFHYDNNGTDVGEFVEVAGPAGLSLSGWDLVAYNGNGGVTYDTIGLSGTIPDQQGCYGTLAFDFSGLQNGAPDGIALVDPSGTVIEFLSYEGSMTATNGPAGGQGSTNVGVSEDSSTTVGEALQLGGTGSDAGDFTWQAAQADTRGQVNVGQTLDGCTGCTLDADCSDGLFCNGAEVCNAGSCESGTPVTCADSIACTIDTCNESTDACVHNPNNSACDDGLFCTGPEVCNPSTGCISGGNPCDPELCDEVIDDCVECFSDTDCDDGSYCNGPEICVAGFCQDGAPIDCSDTIDCTIDTCDEASDGCVQTPDAGSCDDGIFCNGTESCDVELGCVSSGDPCTRLLCDERTTSCVACLTNADCTDGLYCNGVEICMSGACQPGTAVDCDDAIACTVDDCDDGMAGCTHTPDHAACDDGLFCTGAEFCDSATGCIAGGSPCRGQLCDETLDLCSDCLTAGDCDDEDGCTIDLCLGGTCQHDANPACAADCCDADGNGVRDDGCRFCERGVDNCATIALSTFADMGGSFGTCAFDGFANIHDRNHALACFATTNPCDPINIDAGGAFGSCAPDGFCNVHDANHAMTTFGGTNTCVCPGGPVPQVPILIAGRSALALVTNTKNAMAGSEFAVRVFATRALPRLQSYQMAVESFGGSRGALELVDIEIEPRRDSALGSAPAFSAINLDEGMVLAGLDTPLRSSGPDAYLATFVYRIASDARGTFVIDAVVAADGSATALIADFTEAIEITTTHPAIIHVP